MKTNIEVKSGGSGKGWLLWLALIALLSVSVFFKQKADKEQKRADAYRENIVVMNDSIKTYKVKLDDSTRVNAATVQRLAMERGQFEDLYKKEAQNVKKLKIRLSDVESVGNVHTVSIDTVEVPVYIKDHSLKADYSSKWIDISVAIKDSNAVFAYNKRDSLMIVRTTKQKRFWFIRWGKKTVHYDCVSFDPHTKIIGLGFKEIEE